MWFGVRIRPVGIVILVLLTLLGVGSAAMRFSAPLLSALLNVGLPEAWQVNFTQAITHANRATHLPQVVLRYHDCPLLTLEQITLPWQRSPTIRVASATVDYVCFDTASPPSSPSMPWSFPTTFSLPAALAFVPQGNIVLDAVTWRNLPEQLPLLFREELAQPSQLRFAFSSSILTASLSHPSFQLDATWQTNGLALTAAYQWQLLEAPFQEPRLQAGQATLSLQTEASILHGELHVQSATETTNFLRLPFQFSAEGLQITQAEFHWDGVESMPLRAYLHTTLRPAAEAFSRGSWFPLQGSTRLSVVSHGTRGKGNLVFNAPEWVWHQDGIHFPLRVDGNLKFGETILYAALPLEWRGQWHALGVHFLPGALLRLSGKHRLLTIADLRFPLAGIRVDQSGIHGRLQAIFRGESPDFRRLELRLDGQAKQFHAGLGFFRADSADESEWHWRFWGQSEVNALKSALTLHGRGHWLGDWVQLSEFQGKLAAVSLPNLSIPQVMLALTRPIAFDYPRFHLTGALRLHAPVVRFAYGGQLPQPTLDLDMQGMVEALRFNGRLHAGELGPIQLFARRHLTASESELIGRLYWPTQSAKAFQSLLPPRLHGLISGGQIKGETAFRASDRHGLSAGGHFSVQQAALLLPQGEIRGIDFALPYRFQQGRFHLGPKSPLTVRIAEIDLGVRLSQLRVQLQGYYPYQRHKPLHLRELSVRLFGGELNVRRFALPQQTAASLELTNIQMEALLAMLPYPSLQLQGKLNARLPFWLNGVPCYICDGEIEQTEPSTLRFTPTLRQAIRQAGYTEQILAHTIHDSLLHRLRASVNVATDGWVSLYAQLHSQLHANARTRIKLNYRHRENIFDLWRSIQYGTQLEQQIDHQLHQSREQ